ncbi:MULTISPECIES: GNAT family N-acetyltransferase [unclassified Pseudomonas]|uniref:GNAT family N-acetyltransferase n=1 Tax=unclassified Pseudomonas TaxID=196821 RepID=UPI000A1E89BE|nr:MULTISPECIES: GNAT family N-acetyltransferase [unclassified Pseudomonas]
MISVKLRDLYDEDRAAVIAMLRDPKVMKFLGPHRALTESEAESWFRDALANRSRLTIARTDTDEFIGFCGIKQVDGVLDFGYFISSEFWGNGIAVLACKLAVKKLATEINLNDVQVFIAEDNIASQKVVRKLGWPAIGAGVKNGEHGQYYRITI